MNIQVPFNGLKPFLRRDCMKKLGLQMTHEKHTNGFNDSCRILPISLEEREVTLN